jgi:hypothetical protein
MRHMRPLLVFLLSLGIVVQGYASVRLMDPSCVMQQHASSHPATEPQAMQGMHDMDAMHDMEHHHPGHGAAPPAHDTSHDEDSTGHGAHCTGHLGCQLLNSALVPMVALQVARQPVQPAPQAADPAFHSYTAFLLWRPPAPHSVPGQ